MKSDNSRNSFTRERRVGIDGSLASSKHENCSQRVSTIEQSRQYYLDPDFSMKTMPALNIVLHLPVVVGTIVRKLMTVALRYCQGLSEVRGSTNPRNSFQLQDRNFGYQQIVRATFVHDREVD